MEYGEVDLAKLLTEKQGEPVDFPWVTSYWYQVSIPRLSISSSDLILFSSDTDVASSASDS